MTIQDIVDNQGGITQGLPEVFGYFSVLKDFKYTINTGKSQIILFDEINRKIIEIPEIIFIR